MFLPMMLAFPLRLIHHNEYYILTDLRKPILIEVFVENVAASLISGGSVSQGQPRMEMRSTVDVKMQDVA